MAEEVILKAKLDTANAETGAKNLKQQLREAQKEAQNLGASFGEFDLRTQAAARRAAELRDQLDDVNDTVNAFTGAGQFEAATAAMASLAGGVEAATGLMALFGVENENVNKSLVMLQGAMALTEGLKALEDLPRTWRVLYTSITTSTVATNINTMASRLATAAMSLFGVATAGTSVSFQVLKAAIISTGIGALVVAIGYAVNALMDYVGKTDDAAEAQKKLNEEIEKGDKRIDAQYKTNRMKIEAMKDGIEKEKKLIEADRQERITEEGRLHRDQHKNDQMFQERRTAIIQDTNNKLAAVEKKYADEAEKKEKERRDKAAEAKRKADQEYIKSTEMLAQMRIAVVDDQYHRERLAAENASADKLAALSREGKLTTEIVTLEQQALKMKLAEIDKKENEDKQQRIKEAEEKIQNNKIAILEAEKNQRLLIGESTLDQDIAILTAKANYESNLATTSAEQKKAIAAQLAVDIQNVTLNEAQKILQNEKISYDERLAALKDFRAKGKLTEQQYTEAVIQLKEAEKKAEQDKVLAVSGAFNAIGNLIGENTEFGKAAAVASATIDTFVGANKAMGQTGILGIASAVAIIATGLANVRRILTVQIPKPPGGGGGGGMSGSVSAPTAPPMITQTALVQNSPIETTSPSQQVFVLEQDIRSTTNRVNVLQSRGSVG